MRCKCGNDKFYAHQQVYLEVIVDGGGEFHSKHEDVPQSSTIQIGRMAPTLALSAKLSMTS